MTTIIYEAGLCHNKVILGMRLKRAWKPLSHSQRHVCVSQRPADLQQWLKWDWKIEEEEDANVEIKYGELVEISQAIK